MKRRLFVLMGLLISLIAFTSSLMAQEPQTSKIYTEQQLKTIINDFFKIDASDVNYPEPEVTEALLVSFPNAVDIDWEMRSGYYLAEFEIDKIDYKALYDKKGSLLMYQFELANSKIPDVVTKAAKAKYKGMRIDESYEVITAYFTYYRLKMEKGELETTAFFDAKGLFIKDMLF